MKHSRFEICAQTFGRSIRAYGSPSVTLHPQVLVKHDSLYNTFGGLIAHSTYCTGEGTDGHFYYHVYAPDIIDPVPHSATGPSGSFWIGYFHTHFGHFLTSTLQRLWYLKATDRHFEYFTCVNYDEVSGRNDAFISKIFDILKIDEGKILNVRDLSSLHDIVVAEPVFVENSHAYPAWAGFMRSIGHCLTGKRVSRPKMNPLYLSRDRVRSATRRYLGEDILCEALERMGVDICHPEELQFQDQINLWSEYDIVIGFSGSAFINSIFFEGKHIIILNHDDYIFGTQRMIDSEARNRSLYLNAHAYLQKTSDPHETYEITEPDRLAIDLVRIVRTLTRN